MEKAFRKLWPITSQFHRPHLFLFFFFFFNAPPLSLFFSIISPVCLFVFLLLPLFFLFLSFLFHLLWLFCHRFSFFLFPVFSDVCPLVFSFSLLVFSLICLTPLSPCPAAFPLITFPLFSTPVPISSIFSCFIFFMSKNVVAVVCGGLRWFPLGLTTISEREREREKIRYPF